jgi:acetyl-CoA C-acetyltransferase
MSDAYVISGARTPIGRFLGAFSSLPATELGAIAVKEAIARSGLSPQEIDEVILGMILSGGAGQAPARQAALKAGLPSTIAALTINKVCGSGLKAVMLAGQAIRAGDAQAIVAGGMESMTRAPMLLRGAREGWKAGPNTLEDSMLVDGLSCAFENCHMGLHAEHTASTDQVTREDQDRFAAQSQQRAARAIEQGLFADEIVPVRIRAKGQETLVTADEGPRPETTVESLAKLKPSFQAEGTVTAGNASMLSDGAAAVVVASREVAEKAARPWTARIVASHTSGVEPRDIFIAPVLAVEGVLKKAGLTTKDIDLFEINEAFAAQMVACLRRLRLDPEKVNIHGGAIALGHPIGASGARTLVTLLSALYRLNLKRGLVSLCLGGGNAVAMIVER